ncbi:MAG: serine/threonine protein kinase [Verrucomicrobiales bacterium]|nr:serine/threonine protein kinase [Verrucomicrobiales bacterium]
METTYKIIGGDGVEYGPISLPELKAWIADGRIAGRTQIWRSDQARWLPAIQYQELYPEIGQIEALSAPAESGARLAGFWVRVGAYLLDFMLLNLLFLLIWPSKPEVDLSKIRTIQEWLTAMEPFRSQIEGQALIQMVYYVVMHWQFGATFGKMAVRARVTNLDGTRLSLGRSFVRWLGSILNWLTCGIGYVVVAFRADKRGLHDLIAGTKVVYRE